MPSDSEAQWKELTVTNTFTGFSVFKYGFSYVEPLKA